MLISPYLLCDFLKALDGIGSVEAGYLDSLLTDTAGVPCRTTGQHYYSEYLDASPYDRIGLHDSIALPPTRIYSSMFVIYTMYTYCM